MDADPPLYMPPTLRTWRIQRPDETTLQYQDRLSHSCWMCGHYERDMAKLDEHEQTPHQRPEGQASIS